MTKLAALAAALLIAALPYVARADSPSDPACTNTAGNCTQTSLLKSQVNAQGYPSDGAWTSGNGSMIGLLKAIVNKLNSGVSVIDSTVATNTAATTTNTAAIGTPADAAWVSGNGSLVALLKNIANKLASGVVVSDPTLEGSSAATATNTGNTAANTAAISSVTGGQNDSTWPGSGAGSQISILKMIGLGVGNQSDSAWVSGSGSSIALLKTIATKLSTTVTVADATLATAIGTQSDTPWNLIGSTASLISASKATAAATGTIADAAYVGSGNASGISLLKGIYAAVAGYAQASTTSGQSLGLVGAAAVAASPAWVNGNTYPLLEDLNGNLRVNAPINGTQADAAYTGSGNGSVISLLKGIYAAASGYAQASTTAGQAISLVGATATSGPQAWSAGLSYPLIEDTQGNLKVNCIAGCATPSAALPYGLISASGTNATLIGSAGAHTVYSIQCFNNGSSAAYIHFYDVASAPAAGATTGWIKTIGCPAVASTGNSGGGNTVALPAGFGVTNGLGFTITGGMATTDTTAIAATQVSLGVDYR